MTDEDANSTPPPPPLSIGTDLPPPPPMPAPANLPAPPPVPNLEVVPAPPMPVMPAPPPMPEIPGPPPMSEIPGPPPMPEMPAPPPMPEMPAPPPMPEMPAPPPMPEIHTESEELLAPLVVSEDVAKESPDTVELPDPLAALDILSTPLPTPEPEDLEQQELEPTQEISVADYKWKDSVLDAIIDKFSINDRDAFLVHATSFDSNNNLYLTKGELTSAAKEWVELNVPEPLVDEPTSDDIVETSIATASVNNDENDEEEKVDDVVDVASLEMPPLPTPLDPVVEVEPTPEPVAPVEQPPLPEPPALELPPPPMPDTESTGSEEPSLSTEEAVNTDDYRELWKRRSDKSLPQMYGAIDRIGSGEIGSLLDRYSDRFGHELDREIIVMRRAEQDARREAVPVVEVISAPDEDEDEDQLQAQLTEVEDLLRPLQKEYKAAESNSEKKRLAPALKSLIAERKILLGVISGEMDEEALDEIPERPDIPGQDSESDDYDDEDVEEVDEFSQFFAVINKLLGDMPEDWVSNFLESKGFSLFQKVGDDPSSANAKTRKKFFVMINNELGSMPEDMLDEFVSSPDFELYKQMGELYGE